MANTYFCVSTPSHCYGDFLEYYLNKAIYRNIAHTNADHIHYKDIETDFPKTVATSPYKHYTTPLTAHTAIIPAATVAGWSDSAAIETGLSQFLPDFGPYFPPKDHWADSIEDPNVPGKVDKMVFNVLTSTGTSVWGTPYGATMENASYDKLKLNANVKFIFVDFNDKNSSHFDKWWSRVEASHSGDSTWTSSKDAFKAQSKSMLGATTYTTENNESDGSVTPVTVTNYNLAYPTIIDGVAQSNAMVLEIDKLLNKDATTISALATFMGLNLSDLSDGVIDDFKSDIA